MRGLRLYFAVMFLLVFCSSEVLSLGVSPATANYIYDKESGIDESFDLKVMASSPNTKFIDIKLVEYSTPFGIPDGVVLFNSTQMEEYVTLSTNSIDVSKENNLRVRVRIPPHADVYGPNWFGIQLKERPEGEGGFFSITTAVLFKVSIDASYPGQYLDITKFSVDNVNEGESSKLYWQVKGRGEQRTSFIAGFEIFSDKGESVFKRDLGGGFVERLEVYPSDSYYESLPTNTFTPGVYEGVLTVKFLNNTKKLSTKFNIGYESVALDEYSPKNLTYGNINEISLQIRNLWNGEFKNVYGVISIKGLNYSEIKSTTPSGTLTPFGTVVLKQFVDVRALPEGKYDSTITVYFDDSSTSFPAEFIIAKEVVPVVEEKKEISQKTYLIAGISIGALILVVLIVFLLRRKNGPGGHKESFTGTVREEIKTEKKQQLQQQKTKK